MGYVNEDFQKQYQKDWYQDNKDRLRENRKRNKYKWRYNQPWSYRQDLFERQNGQCAICSTNIDLESCHQDHDHTCCDVGWGKTCGNCLRGLLCEGCNRGIGCFKDSPDALLAAIDYLSGHARVRT